MMWLILLLTCSIVYGEEKITEVSIKCYEFSTVSVTCEGGYKYLYTFSYDEKVSRNVGDNITKFEVYRNVAVRCSDRFNYTVPIPRDHNTISIEDNDGPLLELYRKVRDAECIDHGEASNDRIFTILTLSAFLQMIFIGIYRKC